MWAAAKLVINAVRIVRNIPIQTNVSPPSATTISFSRSIKRSISLTRRAGWIGIFVLSAASRPKFFPAISCWRNSVIHGVKRERKLFPDFFSSIRPLHSRTSSRMSLTTSRTRPFRGSDIVMTTMSG